MAIACARFLTRERRKNSQAPSFDSPRGGLPVTGLTARNCSLVWARRSSPSSAVQFSHLASSGTPSHSGNALSHPPCLRLLSRQECISSLLLHVSSRGLLATIFSSFADPQCCNTSPSKTFGHRRNTGVLLPLYSDVERWLKTTAVVDDF